MFGEQLLGSMITGAAGYMGQQQTNEMQYKMMQEQMQFQERMSNTAYQRASKDMQAAGLNPMMMAHGGMNASSPQGASASPLVKSGLDADAVQKAVGSATQVLRTDAEIDNIKADTTKKNAEAVTELQRPGLVDADVALKRGQERVSGKVEERYKAELPIVSNEAKTAANELAIHTATRKLADQVAYGGKRGSQILRPITDVLSSARGVNRMILDRRKDARDAFD